MPAGSLPATSHLSPSSSPANLPPKDHLSPSSYPANLPPTRHLAHLRFAGAFTLASIAALGCGAAHPVDNTPPRGPESQDACSGEHPSSLCVAVPPTATVDSLPPDPVPIATPASAAAFSQTPGLQCRHGAPPPSSPPPPPASPHPECAGVLSHPDVAMVQEVIWGRKACYRRCYEEGLQTSPSLSGRVTVRFVVADGSGVVRTARVESTEGTTPEVANCMAEEVMGLEFPPPSCGDVTVSFPFHFAPEP